MADVHEVIFFGNFTGNYFLCKREFIFIFRPIGPFSTSGATFYEGITRGVGGGCWRNMDSKVTKPKNTTHRLTAQSRFFLLLQKPACFG